MEDISHLKVGIIINTRGQNQIIMNMKCTTTIQPHIYPRPRQPHPIVIIRRVVISLQDLHILQYILCLGAVLVTETAN